MGGRSKKPWAAPRIRSARRILSRLTRRVNATTSSDASYRDKAQLANLKRLIGKLKTQLEDTQRTNRELSNELRVTREKLREIQIIITDLQDDTQ